MKLTTDSFSAILTSIKAYAFGLGRHHIEENCRALALHEEALRREITDRNDTINYVIDQRNAREATIVKLNGELDVLKFNNHRLQDTVAHLDQKICNLKAENECSKLQRRVQISLQPDTRNQVIADQVEEIRKLQGIIGDQKAIIQDLRENGSSAENRIRQNFEIYRRDTKCRIRQLEEQVAEWKRRAEESGKQVRSHQDLYQSLRRCVNYLEETK